MSFEKFVMTNYIIFKNQLPSLLYAKFDKRYCIKIVIPKQVAANYITH